ncbi:MAG TPA: pantoate--beta-alanine ligase [Phnomibacter sp.]|nr:pantoate--beta-alanine ligase [Phnomibacter sp.]
MIIFKKAFDLQRYANDHREKWAGSGFVPTMGALHPGHISLIAEARQHSTLVIASIFVNPTQFNDPADLEKYPVTTARDIQMLEMAGCDVLFLPDVPEIYPFGYEDTRHYALGELETVLEGKYRPGHFQGVCQVVHILLQKVKPFAIFMGQKDLQQCMVIRKLIDLESLPVRLITCSTLREPDGLAMSSRNVRLNEENRQKATSIFKEMELIKSDLGSMVPAELETRAIRNLLNAGFAKVDYVAIADPTTLSPLEAWHPGKAAAVLVAAFLGEVRLIDNMVLSTGG